MRKMAQIYGAADAYVSAYRAEGFNLPVLEAAACGLPVICTEGGSTDDFVGDAFALKIKSRLLPIVIDDQIGDILEPDVGHLFELMLKVMDSQSWRRQAAAAGPALCREQIHLGHRHASPHHGNIVRSARGSVVRRA